ncbi:MAG: aldo/keto reductase [Anaerolineales bacterium]|nr:aldo/keto reductase [Anaerolineales bacterium]
MEDNNDLRPLGKTEIYISVLGLGAWQWGDRIIWAYGRNYGENDVRQAFDASVAAGINWVDTAEMYGMGQSERLLGRFIAESSTRVIIATKFAPLPWRLSRKSLHRALQSSLKRLQMKAVDLYQIHFPRSPVSIETWAEALAEVVQEGLARAVGVSNFDERQMHRAYSILAKHGIPLASNQVAYSLLNRKVEFNGLLDACRELNVTLIAYSPLAQGVLTGKYTPDRPAPGVRGSMYHRSYLARAQPVIQRLREIGEAHGGKTPAQVALNWVICKGAVAIPGAKNARQAQENAGALGWRLTAEEVAALDDVSNEFSSGRQ